MQLLLQYGFVVPDNEHDYIIITMEEPADEAVSAQVESLGPVISVGLDGVVSSVGDLSVSRSTTFLMVCLTLGRAAVCVCVCVCVC